MSGIGFGYLLGSAIGDGTNAYLKGDLDRKQEERKRQVEDRDFKLRNDIAQANLTQIDAANYGKVQKTSRPVLFQDLNLKPGVEDPEAAPEAVPEEKKALGLEDGTEPVDMGGGIYSSGGRTSTGRGSIANRPGTPLPKVEQPKGGSGGRSKVSASDPQIAGVTQQDRAGGMTSEEDALARHRSANEQGRALMAKFQDELNALAQKYGRGSKTFNAYAGALADAYEPEIAGLHQQAMNAFSEAAQSRSVNYARRGLTYALSGDYQKAKPYWDALGVDSGFMEGASPVKDKNGKTVSVQLSNGQVLSPAAFSVLMNPAASMQDQYKALHDMQSDFQKEYEARQTAARLWKDKEDPIIRRLDDQERHDVAALISQGKSPEEAKKQAAIWRADNWRKITGVSGSESKERTSTAAQYKAGATDSPWHKEYKSVYSIERKNGASHEEASATASDAASAMYGDKPVADVVEPVTTPTPAPAPQASTTLPTITSPSDPAFSRLKKGDKFIDGRGTVRVKS